MSNDNFDFDLPRLININYKYNDKNIDYCLDERDSEFIEKMNIKNLDLFENVMDTLDKDWFKQKQKKLQKIKLVDPMEYCDVCTRKETEDDPILVCQGCNVSVHRECYGSSFSKDEIFLCQCCIFHDLENICMFCNTKGGVMKITEDYKFGHILCVLFDKSLDFDNQISKEPIYTQEYKRIERKCNICGGTEATKVECSYGVCMNVYHMGCAIDKAHFDISNKISYCMEHDPGKRRNLFTSNSSILHVYSGYAKLTEKPVIRRKIKMMEWIDTEYNKIIKSEPKIYRDVWSEATEENRELVEKICQYWIYKRKRDKTYGVFYLRHTLNKQN
ncbi:bromodomain-containing protein 1 [Vairimorpha necatrix]|uniref:Bromodomain-containing protein 1 n=1 Tax=Vairimorpha necatrix TaxID=6039 RepID=A0AAX4JDX4_9MICR